MKTVAVHPNLRQVILALTFLLAGVATYGGVHPQTVELQGSAAQTGEESVVVEAQPGINFNEWEHDFIKSLREKRATDAKRCKGKNCQFQDMQALDPSFDF